jgi:hypothetical protein
MLAGFWRGTPGADAGSSHCSAARRSACRERPSQRLPTNADWSGYRSITETNRGRIKWWKSQVAVSAAKSGTRRMKIRFSSGCATARTVRSKLEQLSRSLSEFRNRQCRFKDTSRHSTTPVIAVSPLSGTFVRSAGLQSFQTSPSCRVSPLSRPARWTTRPGSILKCTSTATAPSVGRRYPKPVKDSQRWPLSSEYCAARLSWNAANDHPQRGMSFDGTSSRHLAAMQDSVAIG